MNWDARIIATTILTFVVYGVANWLGNVGHFLPPIILDHFYLIAIGLIFLFRTSIHWTVLPLFFYLMYIVGHAAAEPGVMAFLGNALHLESFVHWIERNPTPFLYVALTGLIGAMVSFYYFLLRRFHLYRGLSKLLIGLLLMSLTIMLVGVILELPNVQVVSYYLSGTFLGWLLLRPDTEQYKSDALQRFMMLLFASIAFDFLQFLAIQWL